MPETKDKVQEVATSIRVDSFLKMEPTDLQKFGHDASITLLAMKRTPHPKPKKNPKGPKTPKKPKP